MWEWAKPAEPRAKLTIVSKHNMATQLMRVIFMAFTSLRNLTVSYPVVATSPHLGEMAATADSRALTSASVFSLADRRQPSGSVMKRQVIRLRNEGGRNEGGRNEAVVRQIIALQSGCRKARLRPSIGFVWKRQGHAKAGVYLGIQRLTSP